MDGAVEQLFFSSEYELLVIVITRLIYLFQLSLEENKFVPVVVEMIYQSAWVDKALGFQ